MMRGGSATFVLVMLSVLAACGRATPTAPSPGPGASPGTPAVLVATVPVSPANGATLPAGTDSQPLTSRNITPPPGTLVFHLFEVAADPGFSLVIASAAVPQSSGETTTYTVKALEDGRRYYWRVHAAAGELAGPSSDAVSFSIDTPVGILTPELFEPAADSQQPARPIFNIRSALAHPSIGVVMMEFQIARDPGFSSVVDSQTKAQSSSGNTTFRLTSDLPNGDYHWRVRAFATDGSHAVTSETRRLSVVPPFAETPVMLSPASGTTIATTRAAMSVAPTRHTGSPSAAGYWFQVARTPDFAAPLFSVGTGVIGGIASMESGDLTPGVYYWRVQARVSAGVGAGTVSSDWTAPWAFIVAPQVIQAPVAVAPAAGAIVHTKPVLQVTNAVRSGPVGALSYRFELFVALSGGSNQFDPAHMVASAVVAEGSGSQTFWTVPAELVPGQNYRWRVLVSDMASGVSAPTYASSNFSAVPAAARLYFLDIELPATCRTNGANSSSYYASSADAFGASTFQLTTSSTLTLTLSGSGSSVSGTIGGGASLTGSGVGLHATISAAPQSTAPALVSGAVIHQDGTMTGLFNGYVGIYNAFGDGGSCTAVGAAWKIRPRTE